MGMYGERLRRGVTREAARKYETSVTERARRERWQASGCARVVSRKYGTVVVPHGSNFAALLNAAEVWGCDWTEIRDAEVWRAGAEDKPVPMPHLYKGGFQKMLISEKGLVRAIKRAYKNSGYVVMNTGDAVAIYTENWFVLANRALLPRKVLATIVEHMGMIPERDMPTSIIKDTEPQLVLRETAADDMDHWRGGNRGEEVTMVPVIMQGYQIYQPPGGGACWGVPMYLMEMIERDPAEHIGADVIDKDRLLWEADGEAVVINAVRKACSGWAKEWERAVWNALEGVDLHKEEAGR